MSALPPRTDVGGTSKSAFGCRFMQRVSPSAIPQSEIVSVGPAESLTSGGRHPTSPSCPPPLERPIVLSANAVPPCNTHVLGWGDRAGIKHANTIDISLIGVPAPRPRPCHQTADLRDHVVWLMKRRGHGLCRRCNGQGKRDTDHHCFLAM